MKTKTKAKPQTEQRVDVVYLRKSTSAQRDTEQRSNVERGLTELGVHVPARYWYSDTRSRNKPEQGADWQTMMAMVDENKVGTIFVESQDRFGGGRGAKRLFAILQRLRDHGTKLIDLRTGDDLTSDQMEAEIQAYFGAKKSDQELLDTTYRSLRSKLDRMKKLGAWPGGPAPLGFDKAVYNEGGQLLYVFHHTGTARGDQYFPDPNGKLLPGPKGIKPPRHDAKECIAKLTPDPTRRNTIEDIFRWFTTEQISRRQIAHRLTARGDKMYSAPWTHANVTTALRNPAYIGTVAYGRSSRAELQQFDKSGKVSAVKDEVRKVRLLADCPQKEDAHPPIVTAATWEAAQKKLANNTRREYAPREAEYYLKGLLICGHCGKALTPSSDKKSAANGGKVYRKYICSSYSRGQATGDKLDKCKAFAISTEAADALVALKLADLGTHLDLDTDGRVRLETETQLLGDQADELREKVLTILDEGLAEYTEELKSVYGMDTAGLDALRWAADIAIMNPPEVSANVVIRNQAGGSLSVADVRQAIEKVEGERVALATRKVAELGGQHTALTLQWARATDRMQGVLKTELGRLESELREWETRTVPLTKRIDDYDRDIAERVARIAEVQAQWPEMQLRQRGEAVRGIFAKIVLFWDRDEKGKITRYPLKTSEIEWVYSSSQMDQAYSRQLQMRELLLLVYRARPLTD